MRAHYLQHVPFEGLGSMESWLKENGYIITGTRFFESVELPHLEDIDLLIVVGGPMSVNNEDKYPWFITEKRFIRKVIETGKSVLGVCLGAQLIASAMGENVYPNREKEIGWFTVKGVPTNDSSAYRFPSSIEVFHWHGETFDLPPGATLLASSKACVNQAFQIGSSVIGLQFHLETTLESARALVSHCREELIPAQYIQTEAEISATNPGRYSAINQVMAEVLSFLQQNIG